MIPCWVCRTNFVAKLPSVTITRGWINVPGRTALHDVADVDVATAEAENVAEDLREQLPGGSDERLSLLVLVEPGRLTDEQHVRVRIPYAEHDLGPPLGEPAPGAPRRFGTDVRQRPAHAAPFFLVRWLVPWRFRPRSDPIERASRANERSSGLSRSGRSSIAM